MIAQFFGTTRMNEFIWNELALAEALDRLQANLAHCVWRWEYRDHIEAHIEDLLGRREHLVAALRISVPAEIVEPELIGFE